MLHLYHLLSCSHMQILREKSACQHNITAVALRSSFCTRENPMSDYYICHCGTRRKKGSTSWTNLTSHIKLAHSDYASLIVTNRSVSHVKFDQFFCTTKAGKYYGWLDFIINGLLSFSSVEKKKIRDHVKHEPMVLSTFMEYLSKLTVHVERKKQLSYLNELH